MEPMAERDRPRPLYGSAKLYQDDYDLAVEIKDQLERELGASVSIVEVIGAGVAALSALSPAHRRKLLRERLLARKGEAIPA